jgi:hypothetical protein
MNVPVNEDHLNKACGPVSENLFSLFMADPMNVLFAYKRDFLSTEFNFTPPPTQHARARLSYAIQTIPNVRFHISFFSFLNTFLAVSCGMKDLAWCWRHMVPVSVISH